MQRRAILSGLMSAAAGGFAAPRLHADDALPPVRPVTKGPKFHWFGYYDKLQFDATDRYLLGMQVDFEHRSPRPDDHIRVGMVDLKDGDRWTELGATRAWSWQQGCMLQWIPARPDEVIWNDRADGQFVSHVVNVRSGKRRTLPMPVYALSPDGTWAITTDFARLNDTRPGYGYAGIPDPNRAAKIPGDTGIWRMDLQSGKCMQIVSLAQAAAVPNINTDVEGAKHWFNHLLVNTDGSRICFLHRWRDGMGQKKAFSTRFFTANPDGSDLYVIDPYGGTSHFIWRDPTHIMAWATHPSRGDKFYLYKDRTDQVQVVAPDVMTVNGHNTYLPPDGHWVLCDTYPDKSRNQNPYLYHLATGRRVWLGHFQSPKEYTGEWRCDTHPRASRGGRLVCVDSPHGGNGRQMYLIDISAIV
jgi:hypothetical protein